jgi:hypothetical protein
MRLLFNFNKRSVHLHVQFTIILCKLCMFSSSLIYSLVLLLPCTWSQKVLLRYLSSSYLLFYKSQILTPALVRSYVHLLTQIHQFLPVNLSLRNENKNPVCVGRACSSVHRFVSLSSSIGDQIICRFFMQICRPTSCLVKLALWQT